MPGKGDPVPRNRYVLYPERNPDPVTIPVETHRRYQESIAEVELQRRLAGDIHVRVALTTATGLHDSDERVYADLLGPDSAPVRCGQLDATHAPGWRWLLRMRVERGVTWAWPARIIPGDSAPWQVHFYH
jgi:hypothetical protein